MSTPVSNPLKFPVWAVSATIAPIADKAQRIAALVAHWEARNAQGYTYGTPEQLVIVATKIVEQLVETQEGISADPRMDGAENVKLQHTMEAYTGVSVTFRKDNYHYGFSNPCGRGISDILDRIFFVPPRQQLEQSVLAAFPC